MNFFGKIATIPRHLPVGTATKRGLMGFTVDKGERYGAAFGFGAAKGYYGPRFVWRGQGIDLWAGAGLTLASVILNAFSGGRSNLADHAERIGDAGVMSALGSLGASWGLRKAGSTVSLLPAGRKAVLGYIPAAMGGAYLSAEDIAKFAQRR